MSNPKFCCVDDFPVLVPYRDLVKLLEVAKNMERYEKCLSRVNEQLAALQYRFTEMAEKVGKIERYL